MSKLRLSHEEKELLTSVEAGNFESVLTESRRKELESMAGNTFKKISESTYAYPTEI